MGIPTAKDIRDLLEGYCLDTQLTTTFTGDLISGSPVIAAVDSFTNVKRNNTLSGNGIPTGTRILSFDEIAQTITMDANATASASGVTVTIGYFKFLSNDWLIQRRDRRIIPWIESRINQKISAEASVTEFYSGNGGPILILNRRPIKEVTALTYVSFADETTGNLINSIEAILEEGILVARRRLLESTDPTTFVKGTNNIKITYTYGFSDIDTQAPEICEAIMMMVAAAALNHIGARTGGGVLSVQQYSRNFGQRGKYGDAIVELERDAYALLQGHFTHIVGAG